jgi:hypothetical protein
MGSLGPKTAKTYKILDHKFQRQCITDSQAYWYPLSKYTQGHQGLSKDLSSNLGQFQSLGAQGIRKHDLNLEDQ